MQPSQQNNLDAIRAWLDPIDSQAKVECDGMTRVISHLLSKNGICHQVKSGLLTDTLKLYSVEVGGDEFVAVTHYWIELDNGEYIDYRARMWMGEYAQHGVFEPEFGRFEYRVVRNADLGKLPESILSFMCGVDLSKWPPLVTQLPPAKKPS